MTHIMIVMLGLATVSNLSDSPSLYCFANFCMAIENCSKAQCVLQSNFTKEAWCMMEGSYTYTSSEGYDEFLGKRGIPWFIRKMILAAPVELQVTLHYCLLLLHRNQRYDHFLLLRCRLGRPGQWPISRPLRPTPLNSSQKNSNNEINKFIV